MMRLATAHDLLPGARLVGDGSLPVARIHTDTRSLRPGDLYLALRGEHHDGHRHLADAATGGAVAAIAEHGLSDAGLPGLLVDDSRRALGQLAAGWRARLDLPLIAVTGSNGKTTVTQMVAAILGAWLGDAALATAGNFNNDIGVPLTLLRLRATHRAAVVELGMNHPGEIAQLAAMAAPTVALVNNAQREHQEFMDGVDAVAAENGAAITALAADGVAVFPAGAAHTALWRALAGDRRCLTFALAASAAAPAVAADVQATATWSSDCWRMAVDTPSGAFAAVLRMAGRHNAVNALAATACAVAIGCPLEAIAAGLGRFTAVAGRSQTRHCRLHGRDVLLVDDSYNANPDSALVAIDLLAGLPAPRWLVLGDMGEVGADGAAFHREVGAHAAAQCIDHVWAVGPLSAQTAAAAPGSRYFDAVEPLLAVVPSQAPACASVLVKGSRFMRMERVVAALCRDDGGTPASHADTATPTTPASATTPANAAEGRAAVAATDPAC